MDDHERRFKGGRSHVAAESMTGGPTLLPTTAPLLEWSSSLTRPTWVLQALFKIPTEVLYFKDEEDRGRFLGTLGDACLKTGWQVHEYCLMSNHSVRHLKSHR